MEVKRAKIELKEEKDLLQGLLYHDDFCKEVVPNLTEVYILKSTHIRTIVKWCINHFIEFNKAPGEHIWDIFESERKTMKPDYYDSVEMVLNSTPNGNFDVDFYISSTLKYIHSRSIELTCSQAMGHIKTGKVEQAEKAILDFKKVDKGIGIGTDMFRDKNIVSRSFNTESTLIDFQGDFGELMGRNYRQDVIGLSASTKKGKSYITNEMIRQIYMDGKNVVLFTLEMEDYIEAQRVFSQLTGKSYFDETRVSIPVFDEDDNLDIKWVDIEKTDESEVLRMQSLMARDSDVGNFIVFGPNDGGVTLTSMKRALETLYDYRAIKPDVIVFDYDALIQSERGMGDQGWEKENAKWIRAKFEFATQMNALVIMVSQLGGSEVLQKDGHMGNVAGSKSKPQHVSHWLILNQTNEEKRAGVMRIANTAGRHGKFNADDEVVVTQCLEIGRGIIDSRWKRKIGNYDEFISGMGVEE